MAGSRAETGKYKKKLISLDGALKVDMVTVFTRWKSGNKQEDQSFPFSFLFLFYFENQLSSISLFCGARGRTCFKNYGVTSKGSRSQFEGVPNSSIRINTCNKIKSDSNGL